VQYVNDIEKYKGRPHDLQAFDEVSDFTEFQYRFLSAWARTTDPRQRVRIVAAGNPPTAAEGEWVIKRWGPWLDRSAAHPAKPGELRWYAMVNDQEVERENGDAFTFKGETIRPRSRTFIPAFLSDNPYLSRTDYESVLQALPEPLRSRLLKGDFTVGREDDPWQLIPTEWVRAAQERWQKTPKPDCALTAIGCDVARGGNDQTTIARRYGNWFAPLERYPGSATPDGQAVASLIAKHLPKSENQPAVIVDVIGIGSSVYDILNGRGIKTIGFNASEKSLATDKSGRLRFVNQRAEAAWKLREALDPASVVPVCLPPDPMLLADRTAARWKLQVGGVQVELKDDIKKRIGRSPDSGDAVIMASLTSRKVSVEFV
jgi:hypothetical protein